MSNVLNLISEETYTEKMDTQNALLKAIATKAGGGLDYPIKINSWAMVQQLVRLGVGDKVFKIGDQFICEHEVYGPLVWDVIGINQDTPADSNYKNSLTIQLHDCLGGETLQFDAPEPTNPDLRRSQYGSNNWACSNIRQWLNSHDAAGEWWEEKTQYDAKPSYADSMDGFLRGLDEEFLSVIGEVRKITANNTVTDGGYSETSTEKIFLPSITEVFGGLNNGVSEGVAYSYYSENTTLTAPGTTGDANRVRFWNGAPTYWWLRSPNTAGSFSIRYVSIDGGIGNFGANNSRGVSPVCCIV
ncbi:MAG: hypothetical protein IKZ25_04215 [Clostridia bacterium]|nr:hypothetical protein [Clostridia bacterium]